MGEVEWVRGGEGRTSWMRNARPGPSSSSYSLPSSSESESGSGSVTTPGMGFAVEVEGGDAMPVVSSALGDACVWSAIWLLSGAVGRIEERLVGEEEERHDACFALQAFAAARSHHLERYLLLHYSSNSRCSSYLSSSCRILLSLQLVRLDLSPPRLPPPHRHRVRLRIIEHPRRRKYVSSVPHTRHLGVRPPGEDLVLSQPGLDDGGREKLGDRPEARLAVVEDLRGVSDGRGEKGEDELGGRGCR